MTEQTTESDRIRVFHGDSRDVLKTFPDAHFDSVVCDPPYALVSITKRFGAENAAPAQVGASGAYARASAGFMGQKWDTGETAFAVEFWAEVFRVLKPGGHVIAFSGTRTYHRLACAVEDSGFEIRDMVAWLYGSGFPKSHDVAKQIDKTAGHWRGRAGAVTIESQVAKGTECERTDKGDPITPEAQEWQGWGTALKPAIEPVVLARKPLNGTVAANVLQHGTGALNIDASRIGTGEDKGVWPITDRPGKTTVLDDGLKEHATTDTTKGRWPANVIHDGSEEVVGAFPETGGSASVSSESRPYEANGKNAVYGNGMGGGFHAGFGDGGGSAARFFYSAKADAEDRLGSRHPTVKPVDLMAYLVRLVTPPGGLTLDPFAGSGTTGVGAMREGMRCVLIEREQSYVADIMRKLAWARGEGQLTALEMARLDKPENQAKAAGHDLPLFGDFG